MKTENLVKANELMELIKVTEKALNELKELKPEERKQEKIYDDKMYWLAIAEHKDCSGIKAELCRYCGNAALLKVIVNELQRQLDNFKEDFEML